MAGRLSVHTSHRSVWTVLSLFGLLGIGGLAPSTLEPLTDMGVFNASKGHEGTYHGAWPVTVRLPCGAGGPLDPCCIDAGLGCRLLFGLGRPLQERRNVWRTLLLGVVNRLRYPWRAGLRSAVRWLLPLTCPARLPPLGPPVYFCGFDLSLAIVSGQCGRVPRLQARVVARREAQLLQC